MMQQMYDQVVLPGLLEEVLTQVIADAMHLNVPDSVLKQLADKPVEYRGV